MCGPGTRYRSRYLEKSKDPVNAVDALSIGVLDEVLGFGSYNLGGAFDSTHIFGTFLFGMATSTMLLMGLYGREYLSGGYRHQRVETAEFAGGDVEMNQLAE